MLAARRLILADEMGLGKTVQAIGCLNAEASIRSVLIVCPKSMLHTWQAELSRWLVRPLSVGVARAGSAELPEADVLLTNYEAVSKHKAALQTREPFDALICDEAHYLKNPATRRAKAVLGALLEPAAKRAPLERPIACARLWLLTGSPMLNHPI